MVLISPLENSYLHNWIKIQPKLDDPPLFQKLLFMPQNFLRLSQNELYTVMFMNKYMWIVPLIPLLILL